MADPVSQGSHKVLGGVAGLITGIVVVAIVAVIFSQRSNSTGLLQAAGTATSGIIGAAVQPVGSGGSSFAPSSYTSPQTFSGTPYSNPFPMGSGGYGISPTGVNTTGLSQPGFLGGSWYPLG